MTAICPAGPPKERQATLTQTGIVWRSVNDGAAESRLGVTGENRRFRRPAPGPFRREGGHRGKRPAWG